MSDQRQLLTSPDGQRLLELLNADADADFISTAIAALVNARTAFLNREDSEWDRVPGRSDDDAIPGGEAHPTGIALPQAYDGTNWGRQLARPANTALDQTLAYLLARAVASGVDSSAGAGSEVVAVEARNADADGDFATTLIGLTTNARPAFLNREDSQWDRVPGRLDDDSLPASETHPTVIALNYAFNDSTWERLENGDIDGELLSGFTGLHTEGPIAGVDNTAAATLRLIEGRNADADADVAAALIGLLVSSRGAIWNREAAGDWIRTPARSDDDAIPAAEVQPTGVSLPYGHDGTDWGRQLVRPANTALDQTLAYLVTRAVASGRDSSAVAGSEIVAIEARNADADADVAAALIGSLVSSRGAIWNREVAGDWIRTPARLEDGTIPGGEVQPTGIAFTHGHDGSNWIRVSSFLMSSSPMSQDLAALNVNAVLRADQGGGGSSLVRVAGRDANADADFAATLFAVLVNSRQSVYDRDAADWARMPARTDDGNIPAAEVQPTFIGLTYGYDSANWRRIGSETLAANPGAGEYGLLTRAFTSGIEPVVGGGNSPDFVLCYRESQAVSGSFLGTIEARESGYIAARRGRRFVATSAGNDITGGTGFSATAPHILIQAGATNDLVLRRLTISITGAAGAAPLEIRVIIDPDSRYSAGGTARTAANLNTISAAAATPAQIRDGAITATAVSGNEREVDDMVVSNVVGTVYNLPLGDGLIIGVNDTILVYINGGTSAPTFRWVAEWEDANVQ